MPKCIKHILKYILWKLFKRRCTPRHRVSMSGKMKWVSSKVSERVRCAHQESSAPFEALSLAFDLIRWRLWGLSARASVVVMMRYWWDQTSPAPSNQRNKETEGVVKSLCLCTLMPCDSWPMIPPFPTISVSIHFWSEPLFSDSKLIENIENRSRLRPPRGQNCLRAAMMRLKVMTLRIWRRKVGWETPPMDWREWKLFQIWVMHGAKLLQRWFLDVSWSYLRWRPLQLCLHAWLRSVQLKRCRGSVALWCNMMNCVARVAIKPRPWRCSITPGSMVERCGKVLCNAFAMPALHSSSMLFSRFSIACVEWSWISKIKFRSHGTTVSHGFRIAFHSSWCQATPQTWKMLWALWWNAQQVAQIWKEDRILLAFQCGNGSKKHSREGNIGIIQGWNWFPNLVHIKLSNGGGQKTTQSSTNLWNTRVLRSQRLRQEHSFESDQQRTGWTMGSHWVIWLQLLVLSCRAHLSPLILSSNRWSHTVILLCSLLFIHLFHILIILPVLEWHGGNIPAVLSAILHRWRGSLPRASWLRPSWSTAWARQSRSASGGLGEVLTTSQVQIIVTLWPLKTWGGLRWNTSLQMKPSKPWESRCLAKVEEIGRGIGLISLIC